MVYKAATWAIAFYETHGFTVSTMNVHASVEPGKTVTVKFKADKEGVYPYYCTEFCSALHLEMQGYLLVKPKGWKPSKTEMAKQNYTEADYKATVKKIADFTSECTVMCSSPAKLAIGPPMPKANVIIPMCSIDE